MNELEARIAWLDKYLISCQAIIDKRQIRIDDFPRKVPEIKIRADALAAENEILRTRPPRPDTPGRGRD